jgi:hypothetical protein
LSDKSLELIVEGLIRAAADPSGVPLFSSGKRRGLFAGTALARKAAEQCKQEGYLNLINCENGSKGSNEICIITQKGLAYLVSQTSPKPILEEMLSTLKGYKAQLEVFATAVAKWQEVTSAFEARLTDVLIHASENSTVAGTPFSRNSLETWQTAAVSFLLDWRADRSGDCPLPELYHQIQSSSPSLSIGRFHDCLRALHERGRIYLHPWTGPLYELPEPQLALLIGHEIAYYASLR